MRSIYLGALAGVVEIPEAIPLWEATGSTWTDAAGQTWDLVDGTSGVVLLDTGIRGLTMPPIRQLKRTSPSIAGSRRRGQSVDERTVFWPLLVAADGSRNWLDLDGDFWDSLHPEYPGTWTISPPGREPRTMVLRFADDGDHAFEIDPAYAGFASYGVTLTAEQPFWRGTAIRRTFEAGATSDNYFGGLAGLGPPYLISSASGMANATVDNPGDEPAWPIWTAYGPFTAVTLGVGARTIVVPFTLTAGQWLKVDTNPEAQTAVDSLGASRTKDLGGATRFAAIPARGSSPLTVTMTGTGTVDVEITPQYYRAWSGAAA